MEGSDCILIINVVCIKRIDGSYNYCYYYCYYCVFILIQDTATLRPISVPGDTPTLPPLSILRHQLLTAVVKPENEILSGPNNYILQKCHFVIQQTDMQSITIMTSSSKSKTLDNAV